MYESHKKLSVGKCYRLLSNTAPEVNGICVKIVSQYDDHAFDVIICHGTKTMYLHKVAFSSAKECTRLEYLTCFNLIKAD